jgi:hypothetical protein
MCIATVAIAKILHKVDMCRLGFEGKVITDWTRRKTHEVFAANSGTEQCSCVRVRTTYGVSRAV